MSNPGRIWLDESSAADAIAERLRLGAMTEEEAIHLRKFADDGYFITRVDLSAAEAGEIDRDVNGLWREKPTNVAFAYDSPPLRFSLSDERAQRRPRYRILQLHAASRAAL